MTIRTWKSIMRKATYKHNPLPMYFFSEPRQATKQILSTFFAVVLPLNVTTTKILNNTCYLKSLAISHPNETKRTSPHAQHDRIPHSTYSKIIPGKVRYKKEKENGKEKYGEMMKCVLVAVCRMFKRVSSNTYYKFDVGMRATWEWNAF